MYIYPCKQYQIYVNNNVKADRGGLSYDFIKRCGYRYWYGFWLFNVSRSQKSVYDQTTIRLCYSRFCLNRSDRPFRLNDGIFNFICILMYSAVAFLDDICLKIYIFFFVTPKFETLKEVIKDLTPKLDVVSHFFPPLFQFSFFCCLILFFFFLLSFLFVQKRQNLFKDFFLTIYPKLSITSSGLLYVLTFFLFLVSFFLFFIVYVLYVLQGCTISLFFVHLRSFIPIFFSIWRFPWTPFVKFFFRWPLDYWDGTSFGFFFRYFIKPFILFGCFLLFISYFVSLVVYPILFILVSSLLVVFAVILIFFASYLWFFSYRWLASIIIVLSSVIIILIMAAFSWCYVSTRFSYAYIKLLLLIYSVFGDH